MSVHRIIICVPQIFANGQSDFRSVYFYNETDDWVSKYLVLVKDVVVWK